MKIVVGVSLFLALQKFEGIRKRQSKVSNKIPIKNKNTKNLSGKAKEINVRMKYATTHTKAVYRHRVPQSRHVPSFESFNRKFIKLFLSSHFSLAPQGLQTPMGSFSNKIARFELAQALKCSRLQHIIEIVTCSCFQRILGNQIQALWLGFLVIFKSSQSPRISSFTEVLVKLFELSFNSFP